MGPIPTSQFRPQLPNTNPNIRKVNATEKRKRTVPMRFRPSTAPKSTTVCLPIPKAPPKPKTDVLENRTLPLVPVCGSTPWPGAGRASGNLFEDRNWLLPPNYLDNENKNDNDKNATHINSPRPPIKEEEKPKEDEQSAEKCGWGPDCPFCKNQEKKEEENKTQKQQRPKVQKSQARRPKTLNLTDKYPSQSKTQNQMRESNIIMNMVMKHSYNNEICQIVIVKTSFSQCNLPILFSGYK